MATRHSLQQLEREFKQEVVRERSRRENLHEHIQHRSKKRHVERVKKHGLLRFLGLITAIVATAVLVTLAMFETLARLLG